MTCGRDAVVALALLWLLASCGGGAAGTSGVAAAPPASSPSPSPAPAPAPAAATCGLPDFFDSALARVNQVRAAGANCGTHGVFAPTGPLRWNAVLTQASEGHARDMATQNYFSHTSLDGRTMSDRIDATGYQWTGLGENIAAGYATVNAVMNGWIGSDGHCANLMNPAFLEVGLACVPGTASSTYNNYWGMNLGTPR